MNINGDEGAGVDRERNTWNSEANENTPLISNVSILNSFSDITLQELQRNMSRVWPLM